MFSIRSAWALVLVGAWMSVPSPGAAQAVRRVPAAPQVRRLPGISPVLPAPAMGQPVLRQGATKNAIYGTIVGLNGTSITLRTRAGRLRTIDATAAFAAGTVSAPLFVGKFVVAEGLSRADGILSAARVSRLTRLEDLDPDR